MQHINQRLLAIPGGPTPGTYGDGTHVSQIVVDAWGNLKISSVSISGTPPSGAAGGVLSGTYPNPGFVSTTGSGGVVLSAGPTLIQPSDTGDALTILSYPTVSSGYLLRLQTFTNSDLFAITYQGTLVAGETGVGFTIDLSTSTVSGTLPSANMPILTGDVTSSGVTVTILDEKILGSHLSTDALIAIREFTKQDIPFVTPFIRTLLDDIDGASARSTIGAGTGSGSVTTVSVVTANGVSGSVANATTTPAITITLGAITPTTVNGNTFTTGTGTLTLSSFTLTVSGTASISGTHTGNSSGINTGDQTITLTGDITGTGTGSFAATIGSAKVLSSMLSVDAYLASGIFGQRPDPLVDLSSPLVIGNLSGSRISSIVATATLASTATALATGRTISITGDLTYTSPSFDGTGNITAAGTLATVASAGTTGSSTAIPVVTINAKGLVTSITTAAVVAPAGTLSGTTLNATVVTSSLTSVGTLTGGATGAGFTIALTTSTVTGTLPAANMPALTGDITTSAGAVATTIGSSKVLSSMLSVDAYLGTGTFGKRPQEQTQPIWLSSPLLIGTLPNAKLANSSVTVTAGTNMTGGGAVSLGASVTLNCPTMVAAGASHAAGAVPDPGATAFSNQQRFLRDDATFSVGLGQFLGYLYVAADESTTSATNVDLTTADTLTFTLDQQQDVLVHYTAFVYTNTNNTAPTAQVVLDTVAQTGSSVGATLTTANEVLFQVLIWKLDNLAAGSHTVKIQHRSNGTAVAHWLIRNFYCQVLAQ